ncbi:MAG: sugar ABC transporter permease [Proteobacteria bacterium]|nr:sugar ABC transporter permease [Pseudomonadota bacterium]MDA1181852.1 sugar ABC transporter permease [Pseudomonadota bacterium]
MNNKLKSFNSPTFLAYVLIAPAAIYILAIVAWPLAETIRLSFTNSGLAGEEYIGLENYEKMMGSKKFNQTVIRTFVWMFFSVTLKLVIGLIGAVLLNAKLPGRGMFRVLIMPPWVVPIAIGMLGWLWLYNGYFGIIAGVGMKTGILDGPFGFLAYKQSAFISTIVADVWVGTPMVTIFFLAAMQGVPRDLYEAAYCDGASRWHRFFKITLPQITPVIITMALLSAIWTFNSFEIIWILTEGGPRGATTTLIIDTYKMALGNYKFGKGAARAVVVMILLTIFAAFYMAILLRINKKVSNG